MKKINEIFYSLQGEGHFTGTPAVFVRFSGCNLKCPFCDTQHEDGVMMNDEEILNEINRYPSSVVILTGGEPSLWIDENFLSLLHRAGKFICIETNGTRSLPVGVDWITCSPKKEGQVVLTRIDELKVVFQGQNLDEYELLPATYYYLQPCSCSNIHETLECVLTHPKWKLSLQTHKLVGFQ